MDKHPSSMSSGQQKQSYFTYWGKSRRDDEKDNSYHLLPYHCLDVAAVGNSVLQTHKPIRQGLSKLTGLDESTLIRWVVFFLAVHDIGKFAVSFQRLRPGLLATMQQRKSSTPYTVKHDCLGNELWKKQLTPHQSNNKLA